MHEEFIYDVRIRDRMLDKGLLTKDALEKYQASLADLEAQAETIPLEQPAKVAAERERA
jgi:hypothetical protein